MQSSSLPRLRMAIHEQKEPGDVDPDLRSISPISTRGSWHVFPSRLAAMY